MDNPPQVPDWIADRQRTTRLVDLGHGTDSTVKVTIEDKAITKIEVTSHGAAYNYGAKGREDFKAGKRDERLYVLQEPHGEAYRRGWQLARLESDTPPMPIEAPKPAETARIPDAAAPKSENPPPSSPTEPEATKSKKKASEPKPSQLDLFG